MADMVRSVSPTLDSHIEICSQDRLQDMASTYLVKTLAPVSEQSHRTNAHGKEGENTNADDN
jgi:hypothetical protein